MKENIIKIVKSDSDDALYIGDNIEISVKDKTISNIVVFIPSDLNIPHVFMIYKIITGSMPGEYAVSDIYAFEMFTKLETCYPCVKDIRRDVSNNPKICPKRIVVDYNNYGIKITVAYSKYDECDKFQKDLVYSLGNKRIREAVDKVYRRNWTKELSKELRVAFNEKGDNNMKYPETEYISNDIDIHINKRIIDNITKDRFYSWRDINIHVSDGVIDYMKLYIPSDLDQIDIYNIYDIITGYVPDNTQISEERMVIVDNKNAIKKMYFYDLLDELKKYYPSIKGIHRTEIYNTPIYPKDIEVCCKDKIIAITVKYGYTSSSFSIPNLSEIYSEMTSEHYKLYKYLYFINGEISFTFDMSPELKEKYKKYVTARPSTENDSKEKATVKVDNTIDDYTWCFRRIRIHASYGTIDEIKLHIPVVAHSGILNNTDVLRIYDIVTGHATFSQFIDEEKLIKIDKEKYIKKIQSYNLLDALKKYYPCLEGMHRNKLHDDQIYPENVNVCCTNDAIIITVKYGYAATCDSFDRLKLLELYSSMHSECSKIFDHLFSIPDNTKDKKIKELKEKINSIYGAPTFEAFDAITDELKDTYIKKNHDYGNSFDKSIDKFGLTAAVVRMNDKMERLNSLLNKDAKVDESIRDTVMDLANYCIMTAMYLDNKKEKK